MLAVAVLLQLASVEDPSPCTPFNGGPAQGMRRGKILQQDDKFAVVALEPARTAGPPLSRETEKLVEDLLAAQRTSSGDVPQILRAEGATLQFCNDFMKDCTTTPLTNWCLDSSYRANRPYLLDDGRIRIEWMKNGTLVYFSLVTLLSDKASHIQILPAHVPMMKVPS